MSHAALRLEKRTVIRNRIGIKYSISNIWIRLFEIEQNIYEQKWEQLNVFIVQESLDLMILSILDDNCSTRIRDSTFSSNFDRARTQTGGGKDITKWCDPVCL